jgi:glycosyltransferase involved in cell wall biosynthesis
VTPSGDAGAGRPLRILSYPKGRGTGYTARLSAGLEALGSRVEDFSFTRAFAERFDVVHLHWPETHLRSRSWWRALGKHARLLALVLWLRARRTKVVWTLHNLEPHERDHWISRRLFALWLPPCCTHVIALAPTGLRLACARYPALRRKPAAILPRGHFRGVYGTAPASADARAHLRLPEARFTVLFFGRIRGYKNVPALIRAFRALPDADVQLVVAGQPTHGERAEVLTELAGSDPRVRLCLRHIRDDEVAHFFGAADLVAIPFSDVLNSGSVLLALSFDRAVLAPRIGALPDLAAAVGPDWLMLYDGPLSPACLVRAREALARPRLAAAVDLSGFEWDAIAERTLRFLRGDASAPAAPGGRGRGAGTGRDADGGARR